ncbi:hypothetical protein R84B8_01440 [Treponema sp. R8-4-B8]
MHQVADGLGGYAYEYQRWQRYVVDQPVEKGLVALVHFFCADFNSSEMAVAVPVLFEINPFVLSGLNSSIYEMIFIQLGVQADYAFGYSEELNGTAVDKEDLWERKNFGIGIVLGAVGYFNSHLSLDVRYYYAFTNYYKKFPKWYPYTGSIGLSFYL